MTSVFSPDSGNIYYFTYHGEWRFSWDGVNLSSKKKKSNYFQNYELITSDLKNNRILAVMQDIYYKDTSLKIYKVELNQKRIISDIDMPVFQEKSIFDEERGLLVTLNEFYGKMYFWDGQKWSYYMSNRPRTSTGGGFCFDQIGKRGVYFGGGESPNYPNEDLRYYPVWDNTYVWKTKA